MKDRIDKNKDITSNSKQIEILKKNFPSCFDKDGNFLPDKLNEIVGKETNIKNESYSLNWLGKTYARLLANLEPETMLEEDYNHNEKEENKNSNNIYIEGDNLEVLKHMVNAYSEKIKMIYIDPPYNTGTDFIYQDDRKFTKEELSKLANIDEEEAQRVLEFTNSNSNSHSAWLTFMYPRLYVARELLKEDGVIFISIDDNEQAQLKLLCDEIFGEENFLSKLIWRKKAGGGNDSKDIAVEHEYIYIYRKSLLTKIKKIPLTDKIISTYNLKDEKCNTHGPYKLKNLGDKSLGDSPGLHYDIECPDGTILLGEENQWKCNKNTFNERIEENRIVFKKIKGKYQCFYKIYLNEEKGELKYDEVGNIIAKGRVLPSILYDITYNKDGQNDLKSLTLNNNFSYPKSIKLLKLLSNLVIGKKDIILDFFSGSATTAHAVMDLNANDNGNRKFIMVNLPESIEEKKNKSAYDFCVNEIQEEPAITTIGKERIRRAAKKIKEENKDKEYINDIDLGFKVYKTKDLIETNYFESLENLEEGSQLNLLNNELSEEDIKSLLLTWKLYDGIEINKDFNTIYFDNYTSYYLENKLYLMYKDFDNNKIKLLLEKLDEDKEFNPRKIILFANNFNTKELSEIKEAIKGYRNKKGIELEVENRY